MAKTSAMLKDEPKADQPVNLGDRAIDNLKFIRDTMERSTHFTAVPGYGGMLMGVTAVAAAYIANSQVYLRDSLITWIVEACLAFAIGLLAMWQKSKIAGTPLVSVPAKKFALSFVPPLIIGVVITLGMWKYEHYESMTAIWMLCYGAAIVCGGAFSVRVVPVMGWCFIVLGSLAFLGGVGWGHLLMAGSLGLM